MTPEAAGAEATTGPDEAVSYTHLAAFTISGPGLTNILTAAAQAYTDSVPLLVVAAAPVSASLGKQWGVLHLSLIHI